MVEPDNIDRPTTGLGLLEPWTESRCDQAFVNLENLFPTLEKSVLGRNVFSEESVKRQVEIGSVTEEMYRKSRYMEYNDFTACKQTYENDVDCDSDKNPPLLMARAIEQQQRYLMLHGQVECLHLCSLIQVVLSNDATNDDFDVAAARVSNFNINMVLEFLDMPLLSLLIIDIYNKMGRCAVRLRAMHPYLRIVQLKRLIHILGLGADPNVCGLEFDYSFSALQIAVFLNLDGEIMTMMRNSFVRPNLSCKTNWPQSSSLVLLLISGYYHRDPENTPTKDRDNVLRFICCLSVISGLEIDANTGLVTDPFEFKDRHGRTVMDYLQYVNGLSRDWPYDEDRDDKDKVYMLRNLWSVLHDIQIEYITQTPRYQAFMTSTLHCSHWRMQLHHDTRQKIFMSSLGSKLPQRIQAFLQYRALQQTRYDAFMSSTLHSKDWCMPVPDELREKMWMQSINPLIAGRQRAADMYKKMMDADF
jgi:hypothetical protein